MGAIALFTPGAHTHGHHLRDFFWIVIVQFLDAYNLFYRDGRAGAAKLTEVQATTPVPTL